MKPDNSEQTGKSGQKSRPEKTQDTIPQYLSFNKELCTACCECIRKCPIKAIRLARGRSLRMVEQCIGCGECIRVCQSGAMSIKTTDFSFPDTKKHTIAILSPVIYTQFLEILPDDIIKAVEQSGFFSARDMTYYLELYQHAATEYIRKLREEGNTSWPVISPICPVVTRLIQTKFPDLTKHILPFQRPVFLAAKDIRDSESESQRLNPDDIQICHITPCPSKLAAFEFSDTQLDTAIGINTIFSSILMKTGRKNKSKDSVQDRKISYFISKRSYLWGLSGGEVSGLKLFKTLSVSGLTDTIKYLEKIEMGLLKGIEYIELRTCPEGCIGGALTGADKFIAKNTAFKMAEIFGGGRRIPGYEVTERIKSGWFLNDPKKETNMDNNQADSDLLSIEDLGRVEELYTMINGKNCAACGAPDCRSFAEDVIRGRSRENACTKLMLKKNRKKNNEKSHNRS